MLACFRFHCQTTLIILTFALMALLPVPQGTCADIPRIPPANLLTAMELSTQTSHVRILHDSQRPFEPNRPAIVITHAMGGTETGDRFHQLAARVQSGDLIWLCPELILPKPATEDFDAIVTISGDVLDFGLPRHPFATETDSESSEPVLALR